MPTTLKTEKRLKKKKTEKSGGKGRKKNNSPKLTEEISDKNIEAMVLNLLKKEKKMDLNNFTGKFYQTFRVYIISLFYHQANREGTLLPHFIRLS